MEDFESLVGDKVGRKRVSEICPGFRETSTKSKNKTFAHVIEKRSIHELPLNQEIISGRVSEFKIPNVPELVPFTDNVCLTPNDLSMNILNDLKPHLEEISDFANMLREVFKDFFVKQQNQPVGLHTMRCESYLVALNNNLPRLDSKKFKWNL